MSSISICLTFWTIYVALRYRQSSAPSLAHVVPVETVADNKADRFPHRTKRMMARPVLLEVEKGRTESLVCHREDAPHGVGGISGPVPGPGAVSVRIQGEDKIVTLGIRESMARARNIMKLAPSVP